jgi:cytochrome c oxidase subunit 2
VPVNHDTFCLFPDSASNLAPRVDALTHFLLLASGFVTLLVLVLIVTFAIKYRRRSEDEVPPATISRVRLEIFWSVVPLCVFMVMFYWGASLYVDMRRPADHALEIHVTGKQWMWKLQHPGGQREIDELHVPIGRPVRLIMISQDVIHSFFIPEFRIKQDVLPGSYTTQWFTATKPGVYHLFCAEYCGTMHSGMVGRVVAMEPAAYEAWLAGVTPDEPPPASGARLFTALGCVQCHGQNGPTLAGLYNSSVKLADGSTVVADENYLRESILNPPAKIVAGFAPLMPSYRGQLTDEQVDQLVQYIKSLGAAASPSGGARDPIDAAMPATRPINAHPPDRLPNQPPAKGSTDYDRRIGNYHQP